MHRQVIQQSEGAIGVLNMAALESALAQPHMTFAGADLYPTLVDKAGVLGYALIQNHPFVDGNKRTGHAAMEVFLVLNGHEIRAGVDEQERSFCKLPQGRETGKHSLHGCARMLSKGLQTKPTPRHPPAEVWEHPTFEGLSVGNGSPSRRLWLWVSSPALCRRSTYRHRQSLCLGGWQDNW